MQHLRTLKEFFQSNLDVQEINLFIKHCHVAACQFQDLAMPFGVNVPQQTSTNTHTTQIQQLAVMQSIQNKQDSMNF